MGKVNMKKFDIIKEERREKITFLRAINEHNFYIVTILVACHLSHAEGN